MLVAAGKGFDQQFARCRHPRKMPLQRQPVAHLVRQRLPGALVVEQFSDALGQIGRERKLAAGIGRHLGVLVVGAGDINLVFGERFIADHLAAKGSVYADHQSPR